MVVHYGKRYQKGYKREKKLDPQEWFEKKIKFASQDVSPILGNFKTKYSPHYKKLFQLVARTLTRKMFAKWASQSGKSLFGIGVAAWKLDQNPAVVIYAIPTADKVSEVLTLKINPVLKSMPDLWQKFEEYSEQEKFRTKDAMKRVPGGALAVKSALSEKDRKSLTSPMVVMDEIGEFEEGAVKEYSERTKSFSRFHPLVLGLSTIVNPSDEICTNHDLCEVKIEWHFICRSCNQNFYPDIDYLKTISKEKYAEEKGIEKDKIRLAEYISVAKNKAHVECPHCSHKISEDERVDMIFGDEMDWFQKHEDGTYTLFEVEKLTTETSFGIDMNSLGSYFAPLQDIMQEKIEAEDNDVLLDKFSRGWGNKFHEIKFDEVESSDMLSLGNGYQEWEIPKDTYRLYMTVDTQKDHFWYEVKAVCYGVVTHSVSSGRLETFADVEDIWEYGQMLEKDGSHYMISKMGIDRRGYNQDGVKRTDEVDAFVEYMTEKYGEDRVYATEGHPKLTGDKSIQVVNSKDLSANRNKVDIKILKMSNIYLKNKMKRAIDRTIEKVTSEEGEALEWENNLFYINEGIVAADSTSVNSTSYTKQYTSEVYDYERDKTGKIAKEKSWIRIHKDNHLWDCGMAIYGFIELDKVSLARKPESIDIAKSLDRLGSF